MGHCSCLTHSTDNGQSAQANVPPIRVDCRSFCVGESALRMKSHSEESGQYYGGVHAPSNTPASHRNVRDFSRPHGSLHVPTSAYPLRLRPALDRAYQPGHQRNRHLRATHREQGRRPSKPSEIFGAERRANVKPQAAPTDSKAAEPSHRTRRTFSIRHLVCQHRADTPTTSAQRCHDFSFQGAVIAS